MSEKKRITLDDVARLAGVSAITVSRALRRPSMVSEAVRKRIDSAVSELGYVPNPAARHLATGRSNVIGVLIPSVTNSVFAEVLKGIYAASEPSDYDVQLANTRYCARTEENALRLFASQKPAGLIVSGFDQSAAARALLESLDCPVVQIMETGENPVDACVGFSHFHAAQAATRHLLAQGYRRPGFLGARMDPRTRRRFDGFRAEATSAGVFHTDRVMTSPEASSVTKGAEMLQLLLAQAPDVDAIFCNNDDLALGALFHAQRIGLSVPDRLGICGFNDLEVMSAANPSLSSVRTRRFDMGQIALEIVLAKLNGTWSGPAVVDLGYEVMMRQSTMPMCADIG
ncbi:HTH-type transcriptional regulator GntR [Hoeflea alexandrii]